MDQWVPRKGRCGCPGPAQRLQFYGEGAVLALLLLDVMCVVCHAYHVQLSRFSRKKLVGVSLCFFGALLVQIAPADEL